MPTNICADSYSNFDLWDDGEFHGRIESQLGFAHEFQFWDYECRFGITEFGLTPYPLHNVTNLYMLAVKLVKYWRPQYGKHRFLNKNIYIDIFLSVKLIF